ncbi:sulfatase-like hydrolase/transferase [Bacteroidota bacterium]
MVIPALTSCSTEVEEKPNIVLIYVDDWAWNGSPIAMDDNMENSRMPIMQMPNVEKLAEEGMKFRNAYGSPQCSPARVCIQTGQSTPRNGFTVYQGKSEDPYYQINEEYKYFPLVPNVADFEIDEDALTIAEVLKPLGYASAHIGKWHMRGDPGEEGYIVHDGATDNNPGNTLKANLEPGEPTPTRLPKDMSDPKLMFSVTEKAIGFIEDQVKTGNPFYLQISHYAMHSGRECLHVTRQKYVNHPLVQAWYKENNKDPETVRRKDDPANWLAMGEDLDGRIGEVLDKLEELGIEDNTYVIMVADNGYRHEELGLTPGLTQPLHARKWWVWDGGIRVPMIVKGPGIKSGSIFTANVVNYDFLPTFVDWAGGDSEELLSIDGVSLADFMAGEKPDEAFLNRNLYFHYPHYRTSVPHSAIISGSTKVMHFYEHPDIPMLFDISQDPGEVSNIAKQKPETHQKLYDEMMSYFDEVGALFPKVNPNYNPEEYRKERKTRERLQWGPFEGDRPLEDDEINTLGEIE